MNHRQVTNRVIAYVDGFNLYYGMKDGGFKRYYWLDIQKMVLRLLRPNQHLNWICYFTSRVSSSPRDPLKSKRQSAYLDALGALGGFQIIYGHYLENARVCRTCGARWMVRSEKMTDVNIATQLLTDAFQDSFDTALLVTADSDLVGPIEAVRALFSTKRIVVAFPPQRTSKRLIQAATAYVQIRRNVLAQSQLPDPVVLPGGVSISKPVEWA